MGCDARAAYESGFEMWKGALKPGKDEVSVMLNVNGMKRGVSVNELVHKADVFSDQCAEG